jgi:serine/threonine protein kinase
MTEPYHLNALPAGTMLQEYEVLRVVGEGSFGIVYLAQGKYLGDLVAIKEYLPKELATRAGNTSVTPTSSSSEQDFLWGLQKFLEEARLLWQLGNPKPHPNIIGVRRFFELHATAYLVMDFEQGEPLSAAIDRDGPLPEEQVWSLLSPLLDGLETVHAAGITHRDIKPDNIFVRTDGTPVLLDFGAARLALGERTQSAFNAMSPAYAATEQLMGSDNIGPWTDIYGLGATLYRAVTGQLPQPPLERLVEERHRSAVELAGERCSRTLLEGIDTAMALRAEDRPRSIADWRALLFGQGTKADEKTTVLRRSAALATPAPPGQAPPLEQAESRSVAEPRRRRFGVAWPVFAGLAVMGLGLGAFLLFGSHGSDRDITPKPTASLGDEATGQTAADPSHRQANEQARRQAEEEARRQGKAEARREAEEQSVREAEARRQAEAEARRQAEAEARRLAKAAEARKAREEAQRQAELEAQREAEAEARRLAEQASIRKAEEEARRISQVVAFEEFLFAAKNTNVRAAPSVDSSKLAMISAGSGVRVTGEIPDGSWYRVSLANGTNGFVWAELLTREPPPAASAAPGPSSASTSKSGADTKRTQEAVARRVPDPAESRSRIAELERFIDTNSRDAELAFRDFATREGMFDHSERFRRVISYEDISFESPQYKISVHYSYCYLKNGCQVLSDSGVFGAHFDGGKLTFLGKAGAPAK